MDVVVFCSRNNVAYIAVINMFVAIRLCKIQSKTDGLILVVS